MKSKKYPLVFISIMVTVLIAVSSLMIWQYQQKVSGFESHQQALAKFQTRMTAMSIQRKIDNLREEMLALSHENFNIKNFNEFSEIEQIQEALHKRLKIFFPNMYAFTIANAHGEEIGGDIDFLIGDICRNDIKWTAKQISNEQAKPYEPMIHAKFNAFHFDMMLPVKLNGAEYVFFMSFLPDTLVEALHEHNISDHVPFLMNTSISQLIEAGLDGVRDKLLRNYYLTEQEQERIMSRSLIPGTKWEIVVVENPKIIEGFRQNELAQLAVIGFILLGLWLTILVIGIRFESRRSEHLNTFTKFSYEDDLTEASNRRKLEDFYENEVLGSKKSSQVRALLFIDVNKFKALNDAYGHLVGDDLLCEVANRLIDFLDRQDIVTRLSSDEFVVLVQNLNRYGGLPEISLEQLVQDIRELLAKPYRLQGQEIKSSASIGGILLSETEMSFEHALRRADKQMYRDKMRFEGKTDEVEEDYY